MDLPFILVFFAAIWTSMCKNDGIQDLLLPSLWGLGFCSLLLLLFLFLFVEIYGVFVNVGFQ